MTADPCRGASRRARLALAGWQAAGMRRRGGTLDASSEGGGPGPLSRDPCHQGLREHGGRRMSQVTLALAGDVMLGREVNARLNERGPAWAWGDLLPELWKANAFLINLECALTSRTDRWHDGAPKAFYFRADPRHVESLRRARVDCAALANNHIGDFGMEGLTDTLEALDRAGIQHAGAGRDLGEACRPAVLHVNDLSIAVVAAADYPTEWAAGADRPGFFHVEPADGDEARTAVERALADARRLASFVIFSIHWGPNMREQPSPEFRAFARGVLEAGADVFWGHSAHVVQGIEVVGEKAILYDTGDFVDDYAVDPDLRNDLSALFLLRLDQGRVRAVDLLPVRIADRRVNLATGDDLERLRATIVARCGALGTSVVARGDGPLLTVPV